MQLFIFLIVIFFSIYFPHQVFLVDVCKFLYRRRNHPGNYNIDIVAEGKENM